MYNKNTDSKILWTPSEATVEKALMTQFARKLGMEPYPYERLHRFSIGNMSEFWQAFWEFAGIIGSDEGPIIDADEPASMVTTRFFPEHKLNFAENMLAGDGSRVAVIEADESGILDQVTMAELRVRVAQVQGGLQRLGIAPGDRVAGMLPNNLDALVMMLAVTAYGGVWSSCSPEFGATGVVDRFGQISPRLMVVASDYLYNGVRHDIAGKSGEIAKKLKGLEHIIVIGDMDVPNAPCSVHKLNDISDASAAEPVFEQLPFDHPLYVVYTSGTTGLPKCIVHRAGGALLNLRKELMLHCDVQPGDRMLYYTNTAWMMYHWSITALSCGATLVLYDGAAIPKKDGSLDCGALWRIAEQVQVTHFGTSPKYLTILEQSGYAVGAKHDLSSLRLIASAGAPLTVENFQWVYSQIKADLCLASISGGTEIVGCFVMGNPTMPVHAGEIQCPALGMAVKVLDERGVSVIGRKGDLVCTEAFPSMPLKFWGEGGWDRYVNEYFAEREGIWTHGDLAEFKVSGGVVISGRTDTTLKPGGVRIGTGEIYRVVENMKEVKDSLVIGYPRADDMEIWLFLVLKDNASLDAALEKKLRDHLRNETSPRHIPKRIMAVSEIPYTLSGKKVEKAVLQVITGIEVKNKGSLINPACLEAFRDAVEAANAFEKAGSQ
jgi:acetoacetyl-CoA synthetase